MKAITVMFAGACLAGSFASAQEETGEYDPDRNIVGESSADTAEAYDTSRDIVTEDDRQESMTFGESKQDSPVNTDFGSESGTGDPGLTKNEGLSKAKAKDLQGKKVVTLTGEEVGEIGTVGKSAKHDERVATIDAGGFLGVGQKTIAVPLSKLHRTPSDGETVRLSMMRTTLEDEPAFDESDLTPEE